MYATGAGETGSYTLSYEQLNGAPKNNRIRNAGFSYDAAGNMTNDGAVGYAYDAASRLKTTGGNTYEYDGDGRRVRQTVDVSNIFYLWSSVLGQPVVELDGAGGVYRAYVYSPGGGLLALQANDFQFYRVHPDHLGSGRRMTDTSGVVVYRAEFDPHGQMMSEWASDGQTFKNSRKFTGYERDWATNLDNANARMLHFRRGRFMQPDPLGAAATDAANPQSLNRYSYVGNDPVNFVDPSGLLLESEDTIRIETWERGLWDIWFLWRYYFGWGGGGSYYQPIVDGGGGGGGGGGQTQEKKEPPVESRCSRANTPSWEELVKTFNALLTPLGYKYTEVKPYDWQVLPTGTPESFNSIITKAKNKGWKSFVNVNPQHWGGNDFELYHDGMWLHLTIGRPAPKVSYNQWGRPSGIQSQGSSAPPPWVDIHCEELFQPSSKEHARDWWQKNLFNRIEAALRFSLRR